MELTVESDLTELKVVQLKAELGKRSLKQAGLKAELVQRLRDYLEQHNGNESIDNSVEEKKETIADEAEIKRTSLPVINSPAVSVHEAAPIHSEIDDQAGLLNTETSSKGNSPIPLAEEIVKEKPCYPNKQDSSAKFEDTDEESKTLNLTEVAEEKNTVEAPYTLGHSVANIQPDKQNLDVLATAAHKRKRATDIIQDTVNELNDITKVEEKTFMDLDKALDKPNVSNDSKVLESL